MCTCWTIQIITLVKGCTLIFLVLICAAKDCTIISIIFHGYCSYIIAIINNVIMIRKSWYSSYKRISASTVNSCKICTVYSFGTVQISYNPSTIASAFCNNSSIRNTSWYICPHRISCNASGIFAICYQCRTYAVRNICILQLTDNTANICFSYKTGIFYSDIANICPCIWPCVANKSFWRIIIVRTYHTADSVILTVKRSCEITNWCPFITSHIHVCTKQNSFSWKITAKYCNTCKLFRCCNGKYCICIVVPAGICMTAPAFFRICHGRCGFNIQGL